MNSRANSGSQVGIHPLFTIPRKEKDKNLKDFREIDDIAILKRVNQAIESECCFLTILKDKKVEKMDIVAVIYSKNSRYVQYIKVNRPIVIFSCFDEVHLIFRKNEYNDRISDDTDIFNSEKLSGYTSSSILSKPQAIADNYSYSAVSNYKDKSEIYHGNDITICEDDVVSKVVEEAIYYAVIQCCGSWDQTSVKAKLVDSKFGFTDTTIDIPISITNKKSDGRCHLNICKSIKEVEIYSYLINNCLVRLFKYQCPFCLVIFKYMDSFIIHFRKYHTSYNVKLDNNILQIEEKSQDESDSSVNIIDFYYPALRLSSSVTYSDYGCSEDRSREGVLFDFCQGISIEALEGMDKDDSTAKSVINKNCLPNDKSNRLTQSSQEFRLNFDSLSESELKDKLSQKAIEFKKVTSPIDLVKQIAESKNRNNNSIEVYFIEPFRLKSNKKKLDFTDEHRSFITVNKDRQELRDLKVVSQNDISFIRRKSCTYKNPLLLDYTLFNYRLQIEDEYEHFDFTDLLSNHLNQRLEQDRKTNQITEVQYDIMAHWNKLMTKYKSVDIAMSELIKDKGLTSEIVELLALLYRRGLVNSSEIIASLG